MVNIRMDSKLIYQVDNIPRDFKTTSVWNVIKVTVKKDFINFTRYKQNFVGQFIRVLMFIVVFYFFSIALVLEDLPARDSKTVFLFFISAMMLMMFDGVTLWGPFQQIRSDLYNGVLESIYANPSSKSGYFIGSVLSRAIFNTIFFLPFFFTVIIVARSALFNVLMILLVVVITLSTFVAIGVIIALFTILFKNITSVVNLLSLLFQFITGAIIPFASLPYFVQILGFAFPMTYGFDLIRYYAFDGNWDPIMPVNLQWIILSGLFTIFVLFSRFLLYRVEIHSKKTGLHLI